MFVKWTRVLNKNLSFFDKQYLQNVSKQSIYYLTRKSVVAMKRWQMYASMLLRSIGWTSHYIVGHRPMYVYSTYFLWKCPLWKCLHVGNRTHNSSRCMSGTRRTVDNSKLRFPTSNFAYWTSGSRRLILHTARRVPDVMFFLPTTSGSRHLMLLIARLVPEV